MPVKIKRRFRHQSKQDYKGAVLYFITIYPPILNTMVECFTVKWPTWKLHQYVQKAQENAELSVPPQILCS
jgi:hypothetical protein